MKTLFSNTQVAVEQFERSFQVNVSEQFINCADEQLTRSFTVLTGLKAGNNLSFSISPSDKGLQYIKGDISKIDLLIFVKHNWNPVTITWRSRSGRIYELNDTDIDCNDIEFSFEGLDIALYQKQFYPDDSLPFKLKDLSYELEAGRMQVECTVTMALKKDEAVDAQAVIKQVNDFVNNYNQMSEKKDRMYGLVHNARAAVDNGHIVYEIDLGSSGVHFMKQLLTFLSDMGHFTKVTIE